MREEAEIYMQEWLRHFALSGAAAARYDFRAASAHAAAANRWFDALRREVHA
jgi:hypothetical protein